MTDITMDRPWRGAGRRLRYIAAGGALLLAGLGIFLWLRHAAPHPQETRRAPALTVTRALPRRVLWPATIEASGAIAPWQEASIGSQIGGYQLIDVRVNVGDHVKKGQVLARLNPALLRADEAQLQAGYEQAQANQKRYLALQRQGAISELTVLQAVTEAKTTQALLAGKRLQLRYTDVVAPDDGVISARSATLGAVVSTGQELFRLIRQDRLEWRGELTASQIVQIAAGQAITLALPDGSSAEARVRQTAPSLDSQSRMGIVYADIEGGSHARAGMFASGQVVLRQAPALVVPAQSVVIRDGRSYLLKLADDSATPKVALLPVTVGRRQGDEVEILQGIGAGDAVVVQGAGFLNDGDIVRLAR